jgi:hypothetical protein
MTLCFCAYNWRLVRTELDRVRLLVYCLPNYGPELVKRLQHLGFRPRLRCKGTICMDRPPDVADFLGQVGAAPGLVEAAQEYAAAWAASKAGVTSPPEVRARQRACARRVLELAPAPDVAE